jgi:hypothetical protein
MKSPSDREPNAEAIPGLPKRHHRWADKFDEPFDSTWHVQMARDAWIGGDFTTVPYYLSRLQEVNHFRKSDSELDQAVQRFFATQYSEEVAAIFRDRMHWGFAAEVLRHLFFQGQGSEVPLKPKVFAAYEAFLKKPNATLAEIARRAKTTEKQILKMSSLTWAHRRYQRLLNDGEAD